MSKVGAVWISGGSGGNFLRIEMNGYEYRAYPNKFKKESKHPDYIIFSRDEIGERKDYPREKEAE
jgi:hypothetical protein